MKQISLILTFERFFSEDPIPVDADLSQIFVVGELIFDEDQDKDCLWLLHHSFPPQLAPTDTDSSVQFRLFWIGNHQDLQSLVEIIHHSTRYHQRVLGVYSLTDLGISR